MVWDLPTRLFHWSFAVCIIGAYISGEDGALTAHELFGLAAFGLVVFRVIWGFIGHETARFSHFLKSPPVIWAYVRDVLRRALHGPIAGHNPLGGLAVIALLALMGAMAVSGLWTGDDVLYEAPLTVAGIAPQLAAPMGSWHQRLHFLVIPLIGLHVLAILGHRLWLKEKLVSRMVTGARQPGAPTPTRTKLGLSLLALCVGGSLSLAMITPNFG